MPLQKVNSWSGIKTALTYGEKYKNSGDIGMLDIVTALEWIHENILKFGGDPNNVTFIK